MKLSNSKKKLSIVLTGGSGSIGRSIVKILSEFNVINIDYIKPKKLEKNEIFFKYDLNDYDKIQNFLNDCTQVNNLKIYALINNAAITIPNNTLQYNIKDWRKTFNINLFTPFILMQFFSKLMIKNKIKGSIVNITSIGAEMAFPNNPAYQSSKAALKHLTKSVAFDLSKYGIRVNSLAPGYTESKMNKKSWQNKKLKLARSKHTFLDRWAKTEEIAQVVKFLIDHKQSSYINGSNIVVDGGWTAKGLIE